MRDGPGPGDRIVTISLRKMNKSGEAKEKKRINILFMYVFSFCADFRFPSLVSFIREHYNGWGEKLSTLFAGCMKFRFL